MAAVNGGLLTAEEACSRYGLTLEEFVSWQRTVERNGLAGLRVTQSQRYHDLQDRQRQSDFRSGYLDPVFRKD